MDFAFLSLHPQIHLLSDKYILGTQKARCKYSFLSRNALLLEYSLLVTPVINSDYFMSFLKKNKLFRSRSCLERLVWVGSFNGLALLLVTLSLLLGLQSVLRSPYDSFCRRYVCIYNDTYAPDSDQGNSSRRSLLK